MKIGVSFFPVNPTHVIPLAKAMDALGYESLWIGEHIAFPSRIESKYPYNPAAGAPLPATPLYDPLLTFTYLAALTQKLRFGTGVYILPLRNPIAAAKQIATLDKLSDGRVIFGAGAGWLKEEFDVLGVPWEHRGSRLEECIAIMRRLWKEPLVQHSGRFYDFNEIGFEPKPVNRSVPVLIGGETPAALSRAARIGDGWYGMDHTPNSAKKRVDELHDLRDSSQPFEVTIAHKTLPSLDTLKAFQEAGVSRVVLSNRLFSEGDKNVESYISGVTRFAEEIIARL